MLWYFWESYDMMIWSPAKGPFQWFHTYIISIPENEETPKSIKQTDRSPKTPTRGIFIYLPSLQMAPVGGSIVRQLIRKRTGRL
jgi:hypothetical protein